MDDISSKKIIIATHVYATGPAFDLRDYLVSLKLEKLLFIGHPLFYDKKLKGSGYELYKQGEQVQEKYGEISQIPSIISYFKDVFLDLYYVLRIGDKWDLYVGNDPLNALAGIVLKKLGRVRCVSYYVIDYNPRRFANKLLNSCYHWLDQFCVTHSDITWNLSPRMAEGRKHYFNFDKGNQVTVPIGAWYDRIERADSSDVNKRTLAFMGHVIEKQGVQHVMQAVPEVIKTVPDFKFLVIGGGDYLDSLKLMAKDLHIEKFVQFTGFVRDHHEVESMLSRCGVAIATYEKYVDGELSFTYFADPGKIKNYLAAGLPVLLSDVSYNAREIETRECGRVIDTDPRVIAEAIITIMQDELNLIRYRNNAIEYAKQFNWPVIFDRALSQSMK